MPWCGGVDVKQREDGRLVASIMINYHGIKQSFTTENTTVRPVSMTMRLLEGPFKELHGTWVFKPLREDACKIEFDLQYEFSNRLIESIIGPVFNMIATSFVDSFSKRADAVYG